MIKLIATDMDGTFLDSNKKFDPSFFETFKKIKNHNIKFVIASGNQYQLLYNKFLPISKDITFVAENGSVIFEGDKEIYTNLINVDHVKNIVKLFDNYPSVFIILCGKNAAYVKNVNREYESTVRLHYHSCEFVENFDDYVDKEIVKIAIYDPTLDINVILNEIAPQLPEELKVVTSGNMWMDIQNKNINKGIALNKLFKKYNINGDESMAFGDQMNDYELLKTVKYSYAMDNAVDDIKEIAHAICDHNDNQGVQKVINEYLSSL